MRLNKIKVIVEEIPQMDKFPVEIVMLKMKIKIWNLLKTQENYRYIYPRLV